MDVLVFRLYGAMASWGEAAVGSDRPSACYPSRSAILGLIGAALGIQREDTDQLQALQQSLSVGVKQYRGGTLLRDYHTSQVPSQNKKQTWVTRKDELSQMELNTVLSTRDYRSEGLWTVAVWVIEGSDFTLERLLKHLRRPVFTLFLGRKSCPLAVPLAPALIKGTDLKTALDKVFPPILIANVMEAAAINWLCDAKRTASWGISIDVAPMILSQRQNQTIKTNSGQNISFTSVDYEGVLTVVDPECLITEIEKGVGKAKAFGCGLLLLRRL